MLENFTVIHKNGYECRVVKDLWSDDYFLFLYPSHRTFFPILEKKDIPVFHNDKIKFSTIEEARKAVRTVAKFHPII